LVCWDQRGRLSSFGYDGAGNIATDARSGVSYAYTYNNANRLKTVSQSGNLLGTYTYNGREQLATRVITNSGSANGTTHFVHDQWGNIIAELDATGATVREYIWLVGAEIAPTRGSRTQVDRPIAVVSNVNTTPALLTVHVDQLNRPVQMTDAAKAVVWSAVYSPFGAAYSITGSETLNARFPGQWFQLEAGLHYNWHRHYDPSLGRYTQPDPLGFVDGPSVYAYASGSPASQIDPEGLYSQSKPWDKPKPHLSGPGGGGTLTWPKPVPVPVPPPSTTTTMPPIRPPEPPGGGRCSCRCRAGNPNDVLSFRFAERTERTCAAAAISACKVAVNYCTTSGGNVHHVQALCSDGNRYGGDGNFAR
jgi:RHS repeat-associated protein